MAIGHFIGQHDQPAGMSDEQLQGLKDYFAPVVELAQKQLEWMKAEEARRAPYGQPADDQPAQTAESPSPAPAEAPKAEGSGEATGA